MPQKVVLLGATGSVGTATLDIIQRYPDKFELLALSGHRQLSRVKHLLDTYHPRYVCLPDKPEWATHYHGTEFISGEEGLTTLASLPEADMVIIGISGLAGLSPTLAAIRARKHLLSANKEAIVAAGPLINQYLDTLGGEIIPLDSEHNAIFTLLKRFFPSAPRRIVLTASGGPFFRQPATANTTLKDVLQHPTWNMGSYITVNSATMLNKGFEVIEAHYLFRLPFEKIDVLIHPQSQVHGIVELTDGTCAMIASPSDMRYPIAMAMFYPDIPPLSEHTLDFTEKPFEFYPVPLERFPLLRLAYETGKMGGLFPLALNALNEEIVTAFLHEQIRFIEIEKLLQKGIDLFASSEESHLSLSFDSLQIAEQKARSLAHQLIGERA